MARTIAESKSKPVEDKATDWGVPVFLSISAQLTGYSEADLEGTGMLEDYYVTLMQEQDHKDVRSFLAKAEAILRQPGGIHEEIKKAFIDLPYTASGLNPPLDEMSYQGLAQRIILMWYTGIWTTMNWRQTKSEQERTAMVSATAYERGLVWVTAGTHPAGAKQPGFNSWSLPPLFVGINVARK